MPSTCRRKEKVQHIPTRTKGDILAKEITKKKKKKLYNLYIANKEKHKDKEVKIETKPLTMWIGHHKEKIKLDIIRMKHHSIILGIEWLERNNLIIDWKKKKIQ